MYYMQNGGDDGSVIAYPDAVGEEIEDFLYTMCEHGTAYPFNPVQHKTAEELTEDGYNLTNVKVIPDDAISKVLELIASTNGGEDEDANYEEIGDSIGELIWEYAAHPDEMLD